MLHAAMQERFDLGRLWSSSIKDFGGGFLAVTM
jgi:hypothetical protein